MKKTFELDFRGKKLVVENGEYAKQAHGAVLVRYGDTVVLSTVVVSPNANILSDFFPLMVLYQEKLYSVGKYLVDLLKGKVDQQMPQHLLHV